MTVAPATAVTLEDYLARVEESHPMFERERVQTDIESSRRDAIAGRQDWQLVSAPSYLHSEPPVASPFEPERIDRLDLNAGASRVFWSNGSRFDIGWSSVVLDQKLPGIVIPVPGGVIDVPVGPSTYYTNSLTATYSMSLLKNRGGELDRLDYDLAGFDVELAGIDAAENQEVFLLEAALKYLDWVLADEQMRIAADRLALAEEELARVRRKRASYLVEQADVLRAEDAVQTSQAASLFVRSAWTAVRAELASLAGWDAESLTSPDYDVYDRPQPPRADAVSGVVDGTRAVGAIDVRLRQLARLEAGYDAAARPELSAFATGTVVGADTEFDRSLEIKHPDLLLGVEFRYPLGNRSAEADLAGVRLQRHQLYLARESIEVTLGAKLLAIVERLRELDAVIVINEERLETTQRKTREELELYNQGRGDLTFVIQSRDDEARARLAYAENALLYHRLVLQFRSLADQLYQGSVN
jgi:outer membrane protein TolC